MSRIGKNPITIPAGTTVTVDASAIVVKGKGGELRRAMVPHVSVTVQDNTVVVSPSGESQLSRALWGTYAAHVRNMLHGVNTPFEKKLILEGVGYKVNLVGDKLVFAVGFSHPVELAIPQGVTAKVEKNLMTITGADRDVVGQFSANIRRIKPPEPYKGKGIRYEGEVIRRKQGKKAASA